MSFVRAGALILGGALAIGLTSGLTACDGVTSPGAKPSATSIDGVVAHGSLSAGDVAYLEDVVAHNGQAIQMAKLAKAQTSTPAVRAAATQIIATETAQAESARALLSANGASAMPPKQSNYFYVVAVDAATLFTLRQNTNAAFDKYFRQDLTISLTGLQRLQSQLSDAMSNPAAKALATRITQQTRAHIQLLE